MQQQQQGGNHSQEGMHLCSLGEKKEKTVEVKVKSVKRFFYDEEEDRITFEKLGAS